MTYRESPSSQRRALKSQLLPEVVRLRIEGESFRDIAARFGVSHETVRTWWEEADADSKRSVQENIAAKGFIKRNILTKTLELSERVYKLATEEVMNEKAQLLPPDPACVIQAGALYLKYVERISKFLALDDPEQKSEDFQEQDPALSLDYTVYTDAELALLESLHAKGGLINRVQTKAAQLTNDVTDIPAEDE